jgi:HK97 gp10 family phage protein
VAFDFNRLLEVGALIEEAAGAIPKKWAASVVQHAQENAPVLTGYMKDNIVDVSTDEEGAAESQAPYSGFVEFGTVHMHAEPFFTPAIEAAKAEIPGMIDITSIGGQ